MDTTILLIGTCFVIAAVVICIALVILQMKKNKGIKLQLDRLEIEKNKIDSTPIIPELSKVESFLKNDKLEAMYNNWKNRLDVIRTNQIPKITDMLLEADYSLSKMDYKSTLYKIAKLEMEIYKVRTNSEFLLNEIKEITNSEERNRTIITRFKTMYRELFQKFNDTRNEFGEIGDSVELQFESIAKRFEEFEKGMENNEFLEVTTVVSSIDEMLKHMTIVIDEIPSIYLMCTSVLPKKIIQVAEEYKLMVEEGYPLDYLNVEYNIDEANKKIEDILSRSRVLNLEDSLFELKVLSDYFDTLFADFEKEKINKAEYLEANESFNKRLVKNNKLMKGILDGLDEIRNLYNLSEGDIEALQMVGNDLEALNSDYKVLSDHTGNQIFAYSKLTKEIDGLNVKLAKIEEKVDTILNSIGSMKDDEVRARQQLEEVKSILKDSKEKIREYNLPIIPQNYFVELNEAQVAIKEIIRELDKKPITVDVLNTRVDTARDLVLKLYNTTKEMMKTAMFAEMAIIYGNRYRSSVNDLDKFLTYAEKLFNQGEYQRSLEISINSLNKVESGIYEKLLSLYALKNEQK